MAKRSKQVNLPEMEDRAIKPLQDAATDYAEIRYERIALNKREATLKKNVLKIMRQHNKVHYAYDGVEIELVAPDVDPDVKVKVAKKKEEGSVE